MCFNSIRVFRCSLITSKILLTRNLFLFLSGTLKYLQEGRSRSRLSARFMPGTYNEHCALLVSSGLVPAIARPYSDVHM